MNREDNNICINNFIDILNYVRKVNVASTNTESNQLVIGFQSQMSLKDISDISEYATEVQDCKGIIDLNSAFNPPNIQKTIAGGARALFFDLVNKNYDPLTEFYEHGGPIKGNYAKYSQDDILNAFLVELSKRGTLHVNPIERGKLVYKDSVILDINRFGLAPYQKSVNLEEIRVIDKGLGQGTATMTDLTEIADELGYEIKISVMPLGRRDKFTKAALLKFYTKFGFQVSHESYGYEDTDEGHIEYFLEEDSESLFMFRKPKHEQ